MAPVAKAAAQGYLARMLLILPMLGINAFTTASFEEQTDPVQPMGPDSEAFDTIVVPAHEDGFKDVFLDQNCWYAIRLNQKHIPKLKYVAAYRVAPIAAVTHIAEVESVEPYKDTGKYKINFKGPAKKIPPINRSDGSEVNMQSPRYALRERLLAAKNLDEIWL
jgi:hypothetical protein